VSNRAPFDEQSCQLVEAMRPEVVSFHFGLPAELLQRVKATGAKVLSSATTVEEAIWLEQHGCDAIIAMGYEAGGHRGMFLSDDITSQIGTFALVPQIADAVRAGDRRRHWRPPRPGGGPGPGCLGSADRHGLPVLPPRSRRRIAVDSAPASDTALTNLFTGRPARGINNRIMRELGR
jgi:nitronate monooxygenase